MDALESAREARSRGLDRLVTTPLMVRMLVTLHLNNRRIPDQRADFFQKYADALIQSAYHSDAAVAIRISTAGGSLPMQRSLLSRIAFEVHLRGEQGKSIISELELFDLVHSHLEETLGSEAESAANGFIKFTCQRGGLLKEAPGGFCFADPAFEEFLTGRYFAETLRNPSEISAFLEQGGRITNSWWREPTVLCIGYLMSTSPDAAHELVSHLTGVGVEAAIIGDSVQLAKLEAVGEACLEWQIAGKLRLRVAEQIQGLLFGSSVHLDAPVQLRASAGRNLGLLGDSRADVCCDVPSTVEIPDGHFPMGHPGDRWPVNLPSLQQSVVYETAVSRYAIGKYPVTNMQYGAFIVDGGYSDKGRRFWTNAGWAWKAAGKINGPAYWDGHAWTIPNHPVVGISWFEAVAYCNWLSSMTGRCFHLPTEAQWEKAAKGDQLRNWPWGDTFDVGMADTSESGIGQTTCVGLFTEAASMYGRYDCSGNVWNWCQTQFRGFGRYEPTDGREEISGVSPSASTA